MWVDYENTRIIVTLKEVVKLRLRVRRCQNRDCPRYHKPYRPECEGGLGWAKQFGIRNFGCFIIGLHGCIFLCRSAVLAIAAASAAHHRDFLSSPLLAALVFPFTMQWRGAGEPQVRKG